MNRCKKLLAEKYYVVRYPAGESVFDVLHFVEGVLERMFARKLYPTYRLMQFILDHVSIHRIAEVLEHIDSFAVQNLFPVGYMSELIDDVVWNPNENVPTPPKDENFHEPCGFHVLTTPAVNKHLHEVMVYICQSTIYMTPNGPLSIDYDVDRREKYAMSSSKENEDDILTINNNMIVYQRLVYMHYFV